MTEQTIVSETYQLGPGKIAAPATEDGPQFALASPAMPAIQRYVLQAVALPATKAEFDKALGEEAAADTDITELIALWKAMQTDAKTWRDKTFDQIVTLAGDIYSYGIQAEVYYGGVKEFAQALIANPDDAQAKAGLKALLETLEKEATRHAERAAAVETAVKTFHENLTSQRLKLVGSDGKGGLAATIKKKSGNFSDEAERLKKEAEDLTATLQGIMDEYHHNVTVAATTPTYAIVSLIGTVIAVVVAGVYGARATAALRKHAEATGKIAQLKASEQAAIKLEFALRFSSDTTDSIRKNLDDAVEKLGSVRSAWTAIAADIRKIVRLIDTNIRQAAPLIMRFGVDTIVKHWQGVAKSADAFRQTAYVKVIEGKRDVLHAAPAPPVERLHEVPAVYAIH